MNKVQDQAQEKLRRRAFLARAGKGAGVVAASALVASVSATPKAALAGYGRGWSKMRGSRSGGGGGGRSGGRGRR